MSEWIKCSERMPIESGRYLAYSPESNLVCICFYNEDLHQLKSNITHWQYLPLPPENKFEEIQHNFCEYDDCMVQPIEHYHIDEHALTFLKPDNKE